MAITNLQRNFEKVTYGNFLPNLDQNCQPYCAKKYIFIHQQKIFGLPHLWFWLFMNAKMVDDKFKLKILYIRLVLNCVRKQNSIVCDVINMHIGLGRWVQSALLAWYAQRIIFH